MYPLLILMAKRPSPGHTKTRLCPPLSYEEAAELYAGMLRDSITLIQQVPGVQPAIAVSPDEARGYFADLAPAALLMPQGPGDLAQRLAYVTALAFADAAPAVAVMSSDTPMLPVAYLRQAFAALATHDLALGPCEDGGYYLAALRRPAPSLFTSVTMSTPNVLRDTMAEAERLDLSVSLLPPCYDIDTPADLVRLQADPAPLLHTRAALQRLWRDG